ncbi:domain found in IF2B/IF5-domain-containing protein [Lipomyces tetrasporus]|uniref:Domain found in IF2B/IF5-domain-containing protein n=1 Tax=Lipomyces tetrasporus TaxID=54092 RepID=A0AAD7QVX4_9ASCO|nr:domain found in IF2B/IF5-domain-containing protein [Lipomyces tetrasporus]KAJ8102499.1 domain found in IF2B/IF5-domain-containing protein [Lipomyces tetrasporus]
MASVDENLTPTAEEQLDFDPTMKKKKKKSKAVSFTPDELDDAVPHEETPDPEVDELTDMFAGLKKKKKKSTSSAPLEPADDEPAADAGAEDNIEDFDFGSQKKKKKKKVADVSAFEQQLEEAGVNEEEEVGEDDETFEKPEAEEEGEGEEEEAGWLNSDREYTYEELLHRFFKILRTNNPELAGERGQRYKIPPPSVMREGNKKTIFANLKDISDRMHRPYEHVMQFLFAELGTSGSVDGNSRLVIKGRFQQKQLENVLRRYIMEYVTCKTCKSISTHLAKENRLYFLVCESCGSRRSVSGIKTGFQAHIGKRKKMVG